MKLSELKARMGGVNVEATVVELGTVREMNKYGKALRVCDLTIEDDSGKATLTLWNDDIDKVKDGDKIKIENGYVNEWQGKLQLTPGKFGKLTVL
jgi:replication factor A1